MSKRRNAKHWYWLTLLAYFSLLSVLVIKISWFALPVYLPPLLTLLIQVGPLLFPLRGLLYGRMYTHTLTSLLALYYFVWGVFDFSGGNDLWLSSAEILLSIALFVAALAYVRHRRMENE